MAALQAALQQLRRSPEFADHEPCDRLLVGCIEKGQRAVNRGEHAAAVDVADDDHRRAG